MARPLRILFPGAFYHITARGNERKEIFRTRKDRNRFLDYLESATRRYGAVFHLYCLMPNHYHLLVETPFANLPRIMLHINGAYTTYFNVKRQRTGHLFQGRYKAILVEKDEYALELSRYIHLNPVRAGLATRPEGYPWSSYRDYIGRRKAAAPWLERHLILGLFGKNISGAQGRYRQFVEAGLTGEYSDPFRNTVSSTILGRESFVEDIRERFLKDRQTNREIPALRQLRTGPSMEEIVAEVGPVFEYDKALSKRVTLYLCHRYSGLRLREIGEHFGIGESAVSQASRRLAAEIDGNEGLKEMIMSIKKELGLSRVYGLLPKSPNNL